MAKILCKTMHNENPRGKPRVFFTCHPEDFDRYFEQICKSIFKTHDCAIYYTEDMNEPIPEQDLDTDLGSNNLLVIPVTRRLLTEENRAMDKDFPYAKRANMPILPIMMEPELDALYSKPEYFGTLQYLSVSSSDATAISYEEKLQKFLETVLISDEMAKRIRDAFDAYIFLSYRKDDRSYANELMRMIHRNPQCCDIAVWYDEFLTPGESFLESIDKILHSSKLFTLLVTPKLLEEPDGKPNFVMAKEYPAAKASGIDILPVEMKPTDRAVLSEKYKGIPPCVPAEDDAAFQRALTDAIQKIAITTNNTDPEHTFLIGLAYLDGIDVEKDPKRGMELVTVAAENQLPEAMKMLSRMCVFRPDVRDSLYGTRYWPERYWEYCTQAYGEKHSETLEAMYLAVQALDKGGFAEEAVCLCRKVYALRCEVLGEAHPDTLDTLLYLADKLVRSQTKKAVALYEKANSPMATCWGPESYKFCNYLRGKAEAYIKLGNVQKALELYDQIYSLRCDIADKDDTTAIDVLNRMAEICKKQGDRQRVLALLEKAYAHQCKVFGEENPKILRSLDALADTYEEQDRHRDAMELHRKAYALRCRAFGEESENVLYYLKHLYRNRGYRDVDKLREKIDALTEKKNKKRETERIEKAPRKQKAGRRENTAAERPAKPASGETSASDTGKNSYWQEKIRMLLPEYAVSSKYLGDENSKSRRLMAELAWCYERSGNHQEAIALYKKASSIHEKLGNQNIVQVLKERIEILEHRSAGIPEKRKPRNTIYLIPWGDRAYRPGIWEDSLDAGARALSDEGSYPVKVTWTRLDLNCEIVWDEQTCEDDLDLLELLDFLGTRGYWIEDLEFLGEDACTAEEPDFPDEDAYPYEAWEALYADDHTGREVEIGEFLAAVKELNEDRDRSIKEPNTLVPEDSAVEAPGAHATDVLTIEEMAALFAEDSTEEDTLAADDFAIVPLDALVTDDFTAEELEALYAEEEPDTLAADEPTIEEPDVLDADIQTEQDLWGQDDDEGAYRTCWELFDDCYGRQQEENMALVFEEDDAYAERMLYGKIYDT